MRISKIFEIIQNDINYSIYEGLNSSKTNYFNFNTSFYRKL